MEQIKNTYFNIYFVLILIGPLLIFSPTFIKLYENVEMIIILENYNFWI